MNILMSRVAGRVSHTQEIGDVRVWGHDLPFQSNVCSIEGLQHGESPCGGNQPPRLPRSRSTTFTNAEDGPARSVLCCKW